MDQLLDNTPSGQLVLAVVKPKRRRKIYKKYREPKKYKKCNECNKRRKSSNENNQICHFCYKTKLLYKQNQSGNKIIDDFIRYTQINLVGGEGKMEIVPYDEFINVEFIAEGGFSKIYKAIWIDGPISLGSDKNYYRHPNHQVVLKKLNNSKNITSKELNELKIFYEFSSKWKDDEIPFKRISEYFGITQDPNSHDIIIIMEYYEIGDLAHFITKDFYNFSWNDKLDSLCMIILGLINIHDVNIFHRDFHSGNIFFDNDCINPYIGDLGISKSAIESTNDNNENYGIIPYMAPEIFKGREYTKASDIYSFGMIMWEFMTGRRPFWNRDHDTDLIIEICDGLRPPIVTNAPKGYIKLMKECWHSDPMKRPTAVDINTKFAQMEPKEKKNPTKIIPSSDIGPVPINHPGAIYKSRPLSNMIQSVISSRYSRSQSINLETDPINYYPKNNISTDDKEKVEDNLDNLIEDNNDNGQNIKRKKSSENENNDYITKEIDFELDINLSFDHL